MGKRFMLIYWILNHRCYVLWIINITDISLPKPLSLSEWLIIQDLKIGANQGYFLKELGTIMDLYCF